MIEYTCPDCKEILITNDNELLCSTHGSFSIIDNIPVLIVNKENVEFDYFQEHWKEIEKDSYALSKLNTARNFLKYPVSNVKNIASQVVFDAGCGDGVHINYLNQLTKSQCQIYGSDISLPALRKAILNNPKSKLSCSDIQKLPFENNVFDISFSYGVIAYTPDPELSFKEICRVTKQGGLIGVWFYPKPSFFKNMLLQFVRHLSTGYHQIFANTLAAIIVPFLYVLPTASKVNLSNASWKQCKEVVLVNIAPPTLWYPTRNDIILMFEQNNIDVTFESSSDKMTVWGKKN